MLVAHGSPDHRSRAVVRDIAAAANATAAFLDFDAPHPVAVLKGLADAGHRRAILVPLLLTHAYHGRVDVPRIAFEAMAQRPHLSVEVTPPVGGPHLLPALRRGLPEAEAFGHGRDPSVIGAADLGLRTVDAVGREGAVGRGSSVGVSGRERLAANAPFAVTSGSGREAADAVVLASAGTRDVATLDSLGKLAAELGRELGLPAAAAYASAAKPTVAEAVAELRGRGARRVAVASYFIAPGVLHDRVASAAAEAGAFAVTPPLGACPELVAAIARRAAAVTQATAEPAPGRCGELLLAFRPV
ncbi:sirohydrochlorin chelatase [Stackebrandtia nassauensis]|uniref:Cobalamin (Vitamin B12) biosynthesis CbiX protein n=1 Tax=Stackebrandtia nassauensis (strain DSM 44728 / CIP 108903 / NRRL B-16338 / NBRC 102104 / LLR-40K-21) TaxID=446470 RepID=D3QBR0_STANL|nr:CbiX/SirB N-terminal domain-containing protein [Stackebrandtia nassauensis]ADD44799.1 cobalamin (vitamin B12) biosynthesis CbiX protein [Stackebrandtia nassauensis DSM 44728]